MGIAGIRAIKKTELTPFSPDAAHRILDYQTIRGDQAQPVLDRLTYEHPIKGILVQARQAVQMERGLFFQWEARKSMTLTLPRDEMLGRI